MSRMGGLGAVAPDHRPGGDLLTHPSDGDMRCSMSGDQTVLSAADVTLDELRGLGQQLRVDSIRASTSAGSGHPTSSMSAADLLAVLIARHLRYDWSDPGEAANDHLIFSKGHASPLLYSVFKAAGVVSDDELMTGYRRFGSPLGGHPPPPPPWGGAATRSRPPRRTARVRAPPPAPRLHHSRAHVC